MWPLEKIRALPARYRGRPEARADSSRSQSCVLTRSLSPANHFSTASAKGS